MTFLQSPKQEIIIPSPGKRTGKTTALFGIVATLLLQRNHISIVTLHVSLRQARFFMERIWSQIKVHLKAFQRNSEYLELVGSRNTLACIPATMRNFRYVGPTYLFVDDGSIQNLKSQFIEECKALGSKVFIVG